MSNFGQDFLKGFTNVNYLRDYTHASKTFTSNQYELKPRFKFLFHVSFTLNTQIPSLNQFVSSGDISSLSYVVKSVDLPKYNIKAETLNQYNRKRVIQTGIEYQPVTLTFHDDGGDVVRNLWYNYFKYYYKDPSQKYLDTANNTNGSAGASENSQTGFNYNGRDIYNDYRQVNDWGYIGESITDGNTYYTAGSNSGKPPFFRDIRIYGMDQHKYAQYVLINPLITAWNHDTYNYSEGGGTMQNTMTIAYETVKYYSDVVSAPRPNPNGFADPAHYDTTVSSLARPGSTRTVFGQGGLLDAAGGALQDLESGGPLGYLGAVQKAGTAYNTFKGKNLASLAKSESASLGTAAIVGGIKNNGGRFFPTPKSPPTN
jgi:hypothetical protein